MLFRSLQTLSIAYTLPLPPSPPLLLRYLQTLSADWSTASIPARVLPPQDHEFTVDLTTTGAALQGMMLLEQARASGLFDTQAPRSFTGPGGRALQVWGLMDGQQRCRSSTGHVKQVCVWGVGGVKQVGGGALCAAASPYANSPHLQPLCLWVPLPHHSTPAGSHYVCVLTTGICIMCVRV